MEEVWSRAEAITYDRHRAWFCGHSVAVHSTVRMTLADAEAAVRSLTGDGTFRFNAGRFRTKLDAD